MVIWDPYGMVHILGCGSLWSGLLNTYSNRAQHTVTYEIE